MAMVKVAVVADGISARTQLFSPSECLAITDWAIRYAESHEGLVHARQEASRSVLRRCREYLVDPHAITFPDGSSVASRVYGAFAVGNVWELEYSEVPSIRVMEYQRGDGYGAHTDWSNGAARERKLSMTCQLTAEKNYEGGDVVLYAGPEDSPISRVQGMATVWPSWTLHEVLPVDSGVRYSLTAWAHGTPYR
jgi:PKHD-type hydroxylase